MTLLDVPKIIFFKKSWFKFINVKDLKNNPTVMKLEGLSVVAEVTDHIEYSEADELKYKQYLLETLESKREAKVRRLL